jgi:hypothetical protein
VNERPAPTHRERGQREAYRREAPGNDGPHREAAGRTPRDQTGHHRADRGGQFGQARFERAPALDELQVLGEEEHQPGQAEDGQ